MPGGSAERLVVDGRSDGRPNSAYRAIWILDQSELTERKAQRVEYDEPADERVALAQHELDRLECLNTADDPRKHAEDTAFRAAGHELGQRRLGVKAEVTGPPGGVKHRRLAFEA